MNEKPNMKDIVDNFWEGITFYIDKIFKTAPFDKTDTAIIKGISEFGYIIDYNRKMYYDVRTIGGTCSINETVKIMIPQNNMNNVFILKGVDITTLEGNFIEKNKITNSGAVNQDGYVADARQLNPNINNTIASNLNNINNSLGSKFPTNNNLTLKRVGDLGSARILKNSSNVADYGTLITNYMQDGSITEIVINDTSILAIKINSSGVIVSNKTIVTF